MQGRLSSSAKVGDAQSAAGSFRQRKKPNDMSIKKKSAKARARPSERDTRRELSGKRRYAEAHLATLVGELSRTYGYGFIGSISNILCALSLASLPLTKWAGTVEESGTETRQNSLPVVDRWAWGIFMGLWVPVFALRCTFAISCGSPKPLPGLEIECWECALPCLVGMVASGSTFFGLGYALPSAFGFRLAYYPFADVGWMILVFTIGVGLTRMLMKAYHKRMEGNATANVHAATDLRNASLKSKGRKSEENQQSSSAGSKSASKPSVEEKKDANDDLVLGLFGQIAQTTNMVCMCFIVVGCESTFGQSGRKKKPIAFQFCNSAMYSTMICNNFKIDSKPSTAPFRSHCDRPYLQITDNNRLDAHFALLRRASFHPGVFDDTAALRCSLR